MRKKSHIERWGHLVIMYDFKNIYRVIKISLENVFPPISFCFATSSPGCLCKVPLNTCGVTCVSSTFLTAVLLRYPISTRACRLHFTGIPLVCIKSLTLNKGKEPFQLHTQWEKNINCCQTSWSFWHGRHNKGRTKSVILHETLKLLRAWHRGITVKPLSWCLTALKTFERLTGIETDFP